ncbi:translocation/assembly module TamB [Marinobacter fuscus]|uniref:Translocation/assembly module TamB n=1 Tax=Marinobacter fuscus TaxID=2109942 RepID=A0A2T1K7Z7_9GAMM|nr:translocation/assembly module TamB domain-containing protein [Marinobacter fuscus]PSF06205.1 translocation/assembly module TamB [Marinobacter fuscus]
MTNAAQGMAPEAGGSKRGRRRWWFWPLVVLLVVILLPLILGLGVLLALKSETGTAWVIDRIPGLQTESAEGSLLGQWQAETVVWQGYGVGVQVQSAEVDWSPTCLFELKLCLETLQIGQLDVVLQPSGEPADEMPRKAIELPAINLPLALNVANVQVGRFTLNDSLVWSRAELVSRVSGATLDLDKLLYQRDDVLLQAGGRVEMRGDWPVTLDLMAQLPPPQGDEWKISLGVGGSVRHLRLSGQSSGYLAAEFEGEVEPLEPELPLSLRLNSGRFHAHALVPETLTLENWQLVLDGSLAGGFDTRLDATLPAATGPVKARVEGLVTTGGVSDALVSLVSVRGGDAASEVFEARGQASWADGIEADAELLLDQFPWYGLVPELAEPPVHLKRLDGEVHYRNGDYRAALNAQVEGPLGEAGLATRLNGDLETVRITRLDMTTGAGSLSGEAELAIAGSLGWDARLQLDRFNPGYWVPLLQGSLNGQVSSRGQMRESGLPELVASLDLQGQWQSRPATAKGRLSTEGNDWRVENLAVSVGDNNLNAEGRYGESLAASVQLDFPAPEQLLETLSGRVTGNVQVSGSVEQPAGEVTLDARQLAWADQFVVDTLQLQATLDSAGRLDANLDGGGLQAAGQTLSRLSATVSGTQSEHSLSFEAEHPELSVKLGLAGALADNWQDWRGRVRRGDIQVSGPGHNWKLANAAGLAFVDGKLTLGQHCWRWQESSVCASDQALWPDTRLAYQVRDFPTQALAPLFPETFQWNASLSAELEMRLADQGPDGRIRIDAGAGEFRVLVLDDWHTIGHDSLVLEAGLVPSMADIRLGFAGPELGDLSLNLSVDPTAEDRPVQGTFNVQSLDLAFLTAFTGLEEILGQVNGQGQISGPLMKPDVRGELALTGGRIFDPGLPLPIDDLVVALEFQGQSADVSGRWKSNDRSTGEVSGTLAWQGAPELSLNLKGDRLPVTLEPYARLEVGPDLNVAFRNGELTVDGRVDVPQGEILVKGVPPSAVSVSDDEIIVGVEREEPAIRAMNMDVTVVVGEDQVSFDAFGVTGNLEGTLRIGNNMDTRGSLQLVQGRYEAFGQELDLRRARILFVGSLTRPYLDIEAVREVDTVVAGIRLSGPVDAPQTDVFSEPSMPQSDALSYVILGRAPRGQADDGQMSRAAISLGLTQANKFTQGVGDELGIRNLTLEAEGSGDQAAVVASGYLTDELSLRYGVGIFEPITTVALRYDLGRYFYLEAASGLAASLDLFYTRNF